GWGIGIHERQIAGRSGEGGHDTQHEARIAEIAARHVGLPQYVKLTLTRNVRGTSVSAKSTPRDTVLAENRFTSGSSPRYLVHVCRFRAAIFRSMAMAPRCLANAWSEGRDSATSRSSTRLPSRMFSSELMLLPA